MTFLTNLVNEMVEEVGHGVFKGRIRSVEGVIVYTRARHEYFNERGIEWSTRDKVQFREAHDYAMSFLRDYIWFGEV